jgi:hypothetical protein
MTATGYVSTTGDARKVDVAGDTMTGELVLPDSSPDTALTAASKGYVDTQVATKVAGPGSATDNAVARFNGTGGITLQNSTLTVDDDGNVTITGTLNVSGYTTLEGGQFNSSFAAFGDMTLIGTGKRYRLRRSGSALDFEGSGVDMLLSMWSAEDFTGTQRSYARLSADAQNTQWAGKFESVAALYGAAVHTLDPDTGVASLGGKNGLTGIRLAGFKNSSGAPATGTWATGDVVLDSAGAWHLCTAGGEPGSWT